MDDARKFWLWDRIEAAAGTKSARKIGQKIGRTHTTIGRWKRDGIPPKEFIRLALELKMNLADLMVGLEWVTWEQLRPALTRVPAPFLTAELHRRAMNDAGLTKESDR